MKVPPINHSFEFSHEEARDLWMVGTPLADDPETDFVGSPMTEDMPSDGRLRRSSDGEWVVRRCIQSLVDYNPILEELAISFSTELERLQKSGVNVISRALTASTVHGTIFSVTPWIPKIKVCNKATFEATIKPHLNDYFDNPPGEVILHKLELHKPWQYSTAPTPELAAPFLHDTDPFMQRVA
jgi:hypothetical protein